MRKFQDYNPISVFLIFVCTTVPALFIMDLTLILISLAGAFLLLLLISPDRFPMTLIICAAVTILSGIINPIFNHAGERVILVINDLPITLEAIFTGVKTGLMIAAALVWFRSFSVIMTSDRLLYVFGAATPKLALAMSMALRYIPLYRRQISRINEAGKVMGLYREDSLIDKVCGGMRVFSVMVTWGLENGVITADSMEARGYGSGRRSRYALFRFTLPDAALLVFSLAVCAGLFVINAKTPGLTGSIYGAVFTALYAVLAFAPFLINTAEYIIRKKNG